MSRKRPASPVPAAAPAEAAAAASSEVVVPASDARSDSEAEDDFSDIEDKPCDLERLCVSAEDLPTAVSEFANHELVARVLLTALSEGVAKLYSMAVTTSDACDKLQPLLYHTAGGGASGVVWDHARRAKREAHDTHNEALRLVVKLQRVIMARFPDK